MFMTRQYSGRESLALMRLSGRDQLLQRFDMVMIATGQSLEELLEMGIGNKNGCPEVDLLEPLLQIKERHQA